MPGTIPEQELLLSLSMVRPYACASPDLFWSRLYAAKAGHKLVKHFSKMPAKKLEHKTGPLKDTVVMLDKTHGWSRNGETAALVNITIGPSAAPSSPVIDLEGL